MSRRENKYLRQRRQVENNLTECSLGCGSTIHFIRSVKFDNEKRRFVPGAYIPVERQLINGDCNKTIVAIYPIELRGRVIPKADPDVQGYEPHFAYCSEYKRQERVQKSAGRKPIPRAVQMELF